jgi:alkylation response protein AidB-like acyl-CoA dehydrogenase
MDFSPVALSDDDQAFLEQTRAFIAEHVTDEVRQRDREFGENFDEQVHLALGKAGYLAADWNLESEGGFTPIRRRIFELEIARAHTPWYHWGTTSVVARLVAQFGAPELAGMVLPGVLSGDTRLCLGYTEPEGGSDVATCKTRAVRDGAADGAWIINGSKMFT